MLSLRVVTVLVGALIALSAGAVQATPPTIIWLAVDLPPSYIRPAPGRDAASVGQGYGDSFNRWFAAHLIGFKHRELLVTGARRENLMRDAKDLYCFTTTLFTPEREQYLYFSKPLYQIPTARLIVRASGRQRFDQFIDSRGALDLAKLLRSETLRGAVGTGRSFGPEIDRVIASSPTLARVPYDSNIPIQLLDGRIDWMIGRVPEVEWAIRTMRDDAAASAQLQYVAVPIAGTSAVTLGYVSCVKTPTGQTVIEAIDEQIASAPDRTFQEIVDFWLNSAAKSPVEGAQKDQNIR